MSEFISVIPIFNIFPENISKDIRLLFVSNAYQSIGYCVTNDEKVWAVGKPISRLLHFKKKTKITFTLNKELCGKQIEEFYEGFEFILARNVENQIFKWKWAHCVPNNYCLDNLKSQKIDYFDDKNIIYISGGRQQCLALSSEGLVYRWSYKIVDPFVVNLEDIPNCHILSINCIENRSFLTTIDGKIYELKDDGCKLVEDINENIKNTLEKFQEYRDECFGWPQNDDQNRVIEIKFSKSSVVCRTQNAVYEYPFKIDREKFDPPTPKPTPTPSMAKTDYKDLFEYFLTENRKIYKTVHVRENQLFVINFIRSEEKSGKCLFVKRFEQIFSNHKQFTEMFETKVQLTSKLKNFRVFNDLHKNIESDVKFYYFSGKLHSKNAFGFYVMTDTVYGFGYNDWGKLGFGDKTSVEVYTPIPELCGQNIQEFFEGKEYIFARNDKNQIFCWGRNLGGQLGIEVLRRRSKVIRDLVKPQKIDYFDDKNIVQICCGERHCLALSSQGFVYGWGLNDHGQTCSSNEIKIIESPIISTCDKFKFIHCSMNSSYVIDFKGKVSFWGKIDLSEDIISKIQSLNVKKILKYSYCYILTKEGVVYAIDTYKTFNKIESEILFSDIFNVDHHFVLQSEECVYELGVINKKGVSSIEKTNFLNFYEYFEKKFSVLYKTIQITSNGFLTTNEIIFNEKHEQAKPLNILKKNVFERKYETLFQEICELGKGGFGTVFKVKHKLNDQFFAIKKIRVNGEMNDILKEVKAISKLKKDFVVQYITAWVEKQEVDRQLVNIAFIQMQFCAQNLKEFISTIKRLFDERFKIIIYFISDKLFRELTECVDYLHSLTPPIIHRDLKPENVLISSNGYNGRFLRLCDFGLAIFHQKAENSEKSFTNYHNTKDLDDPDICHTQKKGTLLYMAPEKRRSTVYGLKSDVYSLALIATEIYLFGDNVQKIKNFKNLYGEKYKDTLLEHKFKYLLETLELCLYSSDFNARPDCKQLLNRMRNWTVDKNDVVREESIDQFNRHLSAEEFKLIKMFYENKLK